MNNPYEKEGSWWWFDETEMDYGPYQDKGKAEDDLANYVAHYLDALRLTDAQADVQRFHQKFGQAVGAFPGANFDDVHVRQLRAKLVLEESNELIEALGLDPRTGAETVGENERSLPGVADAIADLIYVALGAAVTFGIDMSPIWAAVNRTNMAKEGGGKRSDGKCLKPPGWRPPYIEGLLRLQGWKPNGEE